MVACLLFRPYPAAMPEGKREDRGKIMGTFADASFCLPSPSFLQTELSAAPPGNKRNFVRECSQIQIETRILNLAANMRDMQSQRLSSGQEDQSGVPPHVRPSACQFGSWVMSISSTGLTVAASALRTAAVAAAFEKCPWANSKISRGSSTNP